MNDGEDEKEEPVKKHARHEEGHMPGSSSTDPIPMQEQSPAPTTGQEEALAAGRNRDVDEDWEEIAAKIRRSRGGQEDEDMLMIMDLMFEEATENQDNVNDNKEAKLEETFDWSHHPRMHLADVDDEECQPKVCDELTGHELDQEEVLKATVIEIDGLANMGVWPVRAAGLASTLETTRTRSTGRCTWRNAREGLFAAMLPLEALKLVISLTVSKGKKGAREGCAQADVHRHFEGLLARRRDQQRAARRASSGYERR